MNKKAERCDDEVGGVVRVGLKSRDIGKFVPSWKQEVCGPLVA